MCYPDAEAMAFSQNSKILTIATEVGVIWINVKTGEVTSDLGFPMRSCATAIAPNGERVAREQGKRVFLASRENHSWLTICTLDINIDFLSWSPSGRSLVMGTQIGIYVYKFQYADLKPTIHQRLCSATAGTISPQGGAFIATTETLLKGAKVGLWKLGYGNEKSRLKPLVMEHVVLAEVRE